MTLANEKPVTKKLAEAANHTFVYALASLAQSATSFLMVPVYAHYFSPSDYGALALLGMIGSIGAAIFYLGVNSALPVTYFEFSSQKDRNSVFVTALVSTVAGAGIQVLIGFFGQHFLATTILGSAKYTSLIPLVATTSALGFVNQIFLSLLRMQRKSLLIAGTGVGAALLSVGLTFILISQFGFGISSSLWAALVTQTIALCIYATENAEELRGKFSTQEARRMLAFGAPIVIASFGVMTIEWSDRIIIQRFLTSSDVGTYSFGFRIGSMVSPLLISPFVQIINPMLMEYRNDKNNLSFCGTLISLYFLLSGFLIFNANLYVDDFFNLFVRNEAYWAAKPIVIWIMAGCLIYGTTNIFSIGLIYQRKLSPIVWLSFFTGGLNVLLNIWLIPKWGTLGSAFTYLMINTATPIITYAISRKYVTIPLEFSRLVRISSSWALAMLLSSIIPWHIGWEGALERALFGLLMLFFVVFSSTNKKERKQFSSRLKAKSKISIARSHGVF